MSCNPMQFQGAVLCEAIQSETNFYPNAFHSATKLFEHDKHTTWKIQTSARLYQVLQP